MSRSRLRHAELLITEDASGLPGTYTGSVTVPGGSMITGIRLTKDRDFNQTALLNIGTSDEPDAFVQAGEVNGLVDGSAVDVLTSYRYHQRNLYSAADHEIVIEVVVADPTDPPPVDLGSLHVLVTWARLAPTQATFQAAP